MALDLSTYKVANLETSSDTKFNNLIQAVQDAFNALGDTSKGGFTTGLIFDPSQLKQNAAATGSRLVWNGSTWGPVAGGIAQLYDSTAGGSVANFDITSIPSTYNHLRLVLLLRGTTAAATTVAATVFNNDSGANYDINALYEASNPAVVTAAELLATTTAFNSGMPGATATANYFGMIEVSIPCYAQTTANKMATFQWWERDSAVAGHNALGLQGVLWRSTAAINRITVTPAAGSWAAGSRATLYGLV